MIAGSRRAPAAVILPALLAAACHGADVAVELVGVTSFDRPVEVAATLVGGLSGLAWDPACDLYYAVSDDHYRYGPPRLYVLELEPGAGPSRPLAVVELRGRRGGRLATGGVDVEGLDVAPDGTLWLVSEGLAAHGVPPAIQHFGAGGELLDELALPEHLTPGPGRGVRPNLGFEGVAVTPDGGTLFAMLESALEQDGEVADLERGCRVRLLRYDLATRRATAEFVWQVEPVAVAPGFEGGFSVNGSVGLVALDGRRLVVLERSYSQGAGNTVRLYLGDVGGATDVSEIESLRLDGAGAIRPVTKTLLADLGELGVDPDNLEGMTLGPALPDGRRLLVIVSDDNFNPGQQPTQVVFLAVDGAPPAPGPVPAPAIPAIQGAGHASAEAGRCVAGVRGVVTAVTDDEDGRRTLWLEDPAGDGDPATSDAIAVELAGGVEDGAAATGDLLEVTGAVAELGYGDGLTNTTLEAWRLEVVARDRPLPGPVTIGSGGRSIPADHVDDDRLERFEPDDDAIDFFESLEAMRVAVREPVVVGPTSRFGEIVVLPDGGAGAGPRTGRGGLLAVEDADQPRRLLVDDRIVGPMPSLAVGDRLTGVLNGVLDYDYGAFRLAVTDPLPAAVRHAGPPPVTRLVGGGDRLTVATWNVENLSLVSGDGRFLNLATIIVRSLQAPDILALQEVQDDSGPADDGTVAARRTLARLRDAVVAAGGPRYGWRQIDPADGMDGGQPGGNIRVVLLFDPARVEFVDRPGRGRAAAIGPGPVIVPSPSLVAADDPAFAGDPRRGTEGVRKPLACELEFRGRRLFLVNLHLSSKLGDDPQFGRIQPPQPRSERRRTRQAELVRGFVGELLALDPRAAVIVLGDVNEFSHRPPVRVLVDGGLDDLIERAPADERYSYVFQGRSQVLDHILVSGRLAAAAEVEAVHVCADLPASERVSDHDPVIARFSFRD